MHEHDDPCAVHGPDAVSGRICWNPSMSLWNGLMMAGAVMFAPFTATIPAMLVAVVLGALTLMAGLSVGLHRLLAHNAFDCGATTRRVLTWLGVLVGLGGPIGMVRSHHLSDWAQHQSDAHPFFTHNRSTLTHLLWRMHCRIDLDRPPIFNLGKLEHDPVVRVLERTWAIQQLPLAAILFAAGGAPFVVWGVCVRVTASVCGYWLVAHLAHRPTNNRSSGAHRGNDVAWAGWLSMGEAWHSNHHAFPGSAKIGLYPGQSDWGFRFIQLLERLGLAWDVRTSERMAERAAKLGRVAT